MIQSIKSGSEAMSWAIQNIGEVVLTTLKLVLIVGIDVDEDRNNVVVCYCNYNGKYRFIVEAYEIAERFIELKGVIPNDDYENIKFSQTINYEQFKRDEERKKLTKQNHG